MALVITITWALTLAVFGSTDVLLFLAPVLLLVAPLVTGRYLGEELIAKLVRERPRKSRDGSALVAPVPRAQAIWLPRGTRLLAFSLAKRPPPARLLTLP